MATLTEKLALLEQKQGELDKLFADHKDESGEYKMTADEIGEARKRNDELTALSKEIDSLRSLAEIEKKNTERGEMLARVQRPPLAEGGAKREPEQPAVKSLGDLVTASAEYKARVSSKFLVEARNVEIKTLMERTSGFAPESLRTGDVVPFASRTPRLADFIPQTATDQSSIKWMEQTTRTNNAAPKAEGANAGEAAIAYTERSTPIEKIPVWLPVTEEQIEDEDQVRDLINQDLMLMILQKEEEQLLTGNGNTPNLTGFLTHASLQTQAKGNDPVPDAIRKAMTKVRVTGRATPTLVVIHPNDWQDVRLLKTVDGIYIWGSPSEAGPERFWGVPILETDAITENTALVGDFQLYSRIYRKRGISIEATNSHDAYFIAGKYAIKATERLCLVIRRGAAFCQTTGI